VVNSLSSDVTGLRMSDYGARLARRWYVVALGLVLGIVGSLAYASHAGPQYTSTSLVLVTPTDALTQAGASSKDINLDTEAQIVKSAGIAAAAGKLMKTTQTPGQLIKNLTVSVPPNSQVLAIGFSAKSRTGAQQGSHAFAQSYLDNRSAAVANQVKTQTTTLTAQVADLTSQLKKVTGQIASLPASSTDRAYADAQKTILSSQIMALNSRLAPLREATPTPGQIITDAPLPNRPTSPGKPIVLVGGLVVGLLLGLGLAIGLGWFDRRVRRSSDVTNKLIIPVLGELDDVSHRHHGASGPLGDDADRMRNSLVAAAPGARVIQVASTAGPGGSGSTAMPLAASFAQVEHDVVLVLLDPDSSLPDTLGVRQSAGLSDVLLGKVGLTEVLEPVGSMPRMHVLSLGGSPATLSRTLASDAGAELFAELRSLTEYVVIESSDPTRSALAQSLLRLTDTVALAVVRGHTNVRHLESVATEVRRLGGRVEGVVLAPTLKHAWFPPAPAVDHRVAEVELALPEQMTFETEYDEELVDEDDDVDLSGEDHVVAQQLPLEPQRASSMRLVADNGYYVVNAGDSDADDGSDGEQSDDDLDQSSASDDEPVVTRR
jgi:polysaccharide biosynthesis transport protein